MSRKDSVGVVDKIVVAVGVFPAGLDGGLAFELREEDDGREVGVGDGREADLVGEGESVEAPDEVGGAEILVGEFYYGVVPIDAAYAAVPFLAGLFG